MKRILLTKTDYNSRTKSKSVHASQYYTFMTRFCIAYSLLVTSILSVDAFVPCSLSSRRLTSLQIGKTYLESLGSQEPDDENDSKASFPPKVDLGIQPKESVPVPPTSPLDYQEPPSSTTSIPTPPMPIPPHIEEEKTENAGVEIFNPFPVKEESRENGKSEIVITPDAMMANISGESVTKANDEETSLTIAAAAKSTLGIFVSRNYRNTKQALRESRSKNEKRLSRTNYEKEKVAEKIAGIKARAADQIKTLEFELDEKLVEYQKKFDSEVRSIDWKTISM